MSVPDFSGKHVLVYTLNHKASQALFIETAEFVEQAGKTFLVGRMSNVGDKENWIRGLPVGISWDCVESYVVFDTAAQHQERLKEWRAEKKKK
jgi:hypothetical protein